MKLAELESLLTKGIELKHRTIMLVVTRAYPPSGEKVRINGMGLGEIACVNPKPGGGYHVPAWFRVEDVRRYIETYRALEAARIVVNDGHKGS